MLPCALAARYVLLACRITAASLHRTAPSRPASSTYRECRMWPCVTYHCNQRSRRTRQAFIPPHDRYRRGPRPFDLSPWEPREPQAHGRGDRDTNRGMVTHAAAHAHRFNGLLCLLLIRRAVKAAQLPHRHRKWPSTRRAGYQGCIHVSFQAR
ncbi:hypothetical protein C8Q77DRAFT_671431 [Trametes polyzona]|nr:hypothetical protein C8Q77DRAFT_671431 [Trametes polyzona]